MRKFWLTLASASMLAAACHSDRGRIRILPAPSRTETALTSPALRQAAELLLQAIGAHRVVLLGELHGTVEAPALAGQLVLHHVAMGEPVLLGLEIDRNEQSDVDRFLASDGGAAARTALLAAAQWLPPHDGRDSQAMFELIEQVRRLRALGAGVRLVCFDDHDGDMDERNRHMAGTLRAAAAAMPDATLVVLTGNVHAMTRPPPGGLYGEDGRPIEAPMTAGRHLADLAPVSIDISAASGESWVCIAGRCDRRALPARPPQARPMLKREAAGESAWDFSLVLSRFHVSTPAVLQAGAARSRGGTAHGD